MPSFDMSRSRFRLADEHLIVLSELATGDEVPDEFTAARKELVGCGLIDEDGRLSPLLRPMMETVLSPGVVISLETAGRQGKLHHGMLIGERHVVAHEAWPGTAEAEYSRVEPKMLVWKLADMVNLQQSPAGRETAPMTVETAIGTVEAGLAVLESGRPAHASAEDERAAIRAALAAGSGGGPVPEPLAGLISEIRATWRLTSAWRTRAEGGDGVESRGFAVWDCGPLGYWLRELPVEPVSAELIGPAGPFRLVRVTAGAVWARITDLLPDDGELRRAAPGARTAG
ncbi:histidine kinase [Streptomyces sp. CAU 1734]|uniref:histidine kinase n=1 Tax=Streptomyces sp. CAU 1734 TaxID=3140360 RepID=UPI003260EA6A